MPSPLLDASSDYRQVILLKVPGKVSAAAQTIHEAVEEARSTLESTYVAVQGALGIPVSRIAPQLTPVSTDLPALDEAIKVAGTRSVASNLTRIVFDEDVDRGKSSTGNPPLTHSSHVVFCINSGSEWFANRQPQNCATIHCDWAHAPQVIHDVIIDIAVFRGILRLHSEKTSDVLKFCSEVNGEKFRLVKSEARSAPYARKLVGEGYVSLAAFSRERASGTGLTVNEVTRYAEMWRKLLPSGLFQWPKTDLLTFIESRLRQCHGRLKGAINPKAVHKVLAKCDPGRYELWFIRAAPKSKRSKSVLISLFGKAAFRVGVWQIIDPNSKQGLQRRTSLLGFEAYVDWIPLDRPNLN